MVVLGLPPHFTTVQGKSDPPVTVSVNDGEPTGTEVVVAGAGMVVCEIELMLGDARLAGVVIVNGMEFEGPDAADTETNAVPGLAVSAGKIAAVNEVELTKLVTRRKPFQFTNDGFVKFVPVTVSVKPVGLQ